MESLTESCRRTVYNLQIANPSEPQTATTIGRSRGTWCVRSYYINWLYAIAVQWQNHNWYGYLYGSVLSPLKERRVSKRPNKNYTDGLACITKVLRSTDGNDRLLVPDFIFIHGTVVCGDLVGAQPGQLRRREAITWIFQRSSSRLGIALLAPRRNNITTAALLLLRPNHW